MTDLKTRADARLGAALQDADQQDPRPLYRPALKYLRARKPDAFSDALRYFEDELLPAVAGEADPLEAWLDYGRRLARALGDGRLLELDSTGRARPVEDPATARGLVLHIPDDAGAPALTLRYPTDPSPAQRAALELLVEGRQTASAYAGG
ncbi:MAG: hypothetical protein R6U63_14305 [Longimicrobiales bacterium]